MTASHRTKSHKWHFSTNRTKHATIYNFREKELLAFFRVKFIGQKVTFLNICGFHWSTNLMKNIHF